MLKICRISAAMLLAAALPARAQTAAPQYANGSEVRPAIGVFVVDQNGNAQGSAANPIAVGGASLSALAGATNAPIPAQSAQGVDIGLVEIAANTGTGVAVVPMTAATASVNIAAATTTQIAAAIPGQSIRVTAFYLVSAGANTMTFEYGTGTNCGTGTTVIGGAQTLATGSGAAMGTGVGTIIMVPAGQALCIVTGAAAQLSGFMSYAQY